MKKIKIIRNILIVLVILIAIIYVFSMRSDRIESSKTAKIYKNMFRESYKEQKSITMQISYNNEKMKMTMLQATDNKEGKEISCFIHDNYEDIKRDPDSEGTITYSVTTKNGINHYNVFPKVKRYEMTRASKEESDSYDTWISDRLTEVLECNYYTKGYEIINGKLLYYEKFKEAGLKMYFYNNELLYMKSTELDKSFNDIENALYNIKITYDDTYKKYTEIPKEYKGYIIKYDNETNETERIEIK